MIVESNRFASIAVIILVNLLAVIVLLAGLEMIIRILYPEILPISTSRDLAIDPFYGTTAKLRPGTTGISDGASFTVDDRGFWLYSENGDSSKPAWLLIGDSVTMGIGVEPDATFAGRLASSARSQILNPSWLGYSSADYRTIVTVLLTDSGMHHLNIRKVLLFWTLNDVYSNLDFGEEPGSSVRQIGDEFLLFVRKHFRTYQWLKHLITDRPRDYFEFDRKFYSPTSDHFIAAATDLDHIRDLCLRRGIAFEVVLLPYEYQLRKGAARDLFPQQLMNSQLNKRGIGFIDVADSVLNQGTDTKSLFRFGDGIHFSRTGHEAVFHIIVESGIASF